MKKIKRISFDVSGLYITLLLCIATVFIGSINILQILAIACSRSTNIAMVLKKRAENRKIFFSKQMGSVLRSQWLNDEKTGPHHYFRLEGEYAWIHGGAFPAQKQIFKYLREQGVDRIVTLTVERVKTGRNINHQPEDFYLAQWTDSDLEESDLEQFEFMHVPIVDMGFPTPENASKLLEIAKQSISEKKTVYFHCWAGRGRTCTAIMHILMNLHGMSFAVAKQKIQKSTPHFDLKPAQISFLTQDDDFPKYIQSFFVPRVLTPVHERCYTEPPEPIETSLPVESRAVAGNVQEVALQRKDTDDANK